MRLRVGMYHIFIKDWMDVFPRNQILVIKTEDMEETKLKKIYEQLFHFLEISMWFIFVYTQQKVKEIVFEGL